MKNKGVNKGVNCNVTRNMITKSKATGGRGETKPASPLISCPTSPLLYHNCLVYLPSIASLCLQSPLLQILQGFNLFKASDKMCTWCALTSLHLSPFLQEQKPPSSLDCYVGIVCQSFVCHIAYPANIINMVKLLPPPAAWV